MLAAAAVFSLSVSQRSRMLATDGTKISTSAIITKATVNSSSRPERPEKNPAIGTSCGLSDEPSRCIIQSPGRRLDASNFNRAGEENVRARESTGGAPSVHNTKLPRAFQSPPVSDMERGNR